MDIANIIIAILSGCAVCIPLAIKLVQYVSTSVKEKNWNDIVKLAIGYMTTAETKFTDNETRKEWVLAMVKSSAKSVNYDLDDVSLHKISDMIDSICTAAKTINNTIKENETNNTSTPAPATNNTAQAA